MELKDIILIITLIIGSGAVKILWSLIKEVKELYNVVKKAYEDKLVTPEEEKIIAKEAIDTLKEAVKLNNIIIKLLPKFQTSKSK